MKIATWNVERLKHRKALNDIVSICERVSADIMVLTETDAQIRLPYRHSFHTPRAAEVNPSLYTPTENRVSIFTNYPCVAQHCTFDEYTALCIELETEMGRLAVYGTIIGVYGNRHRSFKTDLERQIEDYKRLAQTVPNLCICGDFNCSFADNYYYTKQGRYALEQSFSENRLVLLTGAVGECIDHIAVSGAFCTGADIAIEEWNLDRTLSDHKGIAVSFNLV